AKGAPLHLFLHGGYWRSGSKADHHLVAAPVLAAGGIAAIASYDLMPGTRLGPIVAQVRAAARHLVALAPELGADPARFSASGHSAGAHLASYLAARGPEETAPDLPPLRGLLLVSGLYDLSGIPGSFLKDEAAMTAAEAAAWSPLVAEQVPGPLRIVTRGSEETAPFHDQAQGFAKLLQSRGLPHRLCEEPGLNHLSIVLSLADPASPLGMLLSELTAG
ncbi:MAG: alpha/beta hydrolase, partial [Cereibacter changlensis]